MRHLVKSFQNHLGERGCHFYDEEECRFLYWDQVMSLLKSIPDEKSDGFSERLVDNLSNYNPDTEFLAVQQQGSTVSVELYTASSL